MVRGSDMLCSVSVQLFVRLCCITVSFQFCNKLHAQLCSFRYKCHYFTFIPYLLFTVLLFYFGCSYYINPDYSYTTVRYNKLLISWGSNMYAFMDMSQFNVMECIETDYFCTYYFYVMV